MKNFSLGDLHYFDGRLVLSMLVCIDSLAPFHRKSFCLKTIMYVFLSVFFSFIYNLFMYFFSRCIFFSICFFFQYVLLFTEFYYYVCVHFLFVFFTVIFVCICFFYFFNFFFIWISSKLNLKHKKDFLFYHFHPLQ